MNKNSSITDQTSGNGLLDCSKLAINWKIDNDVTICRHEIIVNFWRCQVGLIKISYWSKFHVNIVTGSRVMAIFECCKMYGRATAFYRFWVIKGKPKGGSNTHHHYPRLGLTNCITIFMSILFSLEGPLILGSFI